MMRVRRSLHLLFTLIAITHLSFVCLSAAAEQRTAAQIVFGGDHAYPPFEWDDGGTPKGFNIELEQAIARLAGFDVQHRLGDWPDIIRALETGEVDVVPMFRSDERAKRFIFVPPFYQVDHAIFSKAGSDTIVSLDQLAGRKIAVEELSYAHRRLQNEGVEAQFVLVGDTLEALQAVVRGEADYALLAAITASHLIRLNQLPLNRVGPPFWPRPYAFAVSRTRPELAEQLSRGLHDAIASGQYQALFERWQDQLTPGGTNWVSILKALGIVMAPVLLIGGLGWMWSWGLRRTVAIRTRELAQELTLRQEAQDRIRHLADHDALTGLPNLEHFLKLVNAVLNSANCDAGQKEVITLRLSEMGKITRTFGYAVGQQLVSEFSSQLRQADFDLCAYIGRGVFAVLAERNLARYRLNLLTVELDACGVCLSPHVAAGVAIWPIHAKNAEDLVRLAETALAVGSANKRSWCEYEPSMEPDKKDMQLVTDFRRSQKRQLYVVYQPQVDLLSGEIVAAEALVRWMHPEHGLIAPSRFIPLLENAGLISEITDYMVQEAARVVGALRQRATPCCISINVTANDLLDGKLLESIHGLVARGEIQPGDLKLELTETSVAENPYQIKEALTKLLRIGVYASVDDFGTGYSSLSHLSAFPVSEVKIDSSFVRDMLANKRNRGIVRSTVSMAHELGLTVVAEGAEDDATLDALRDDGCDRVQGYVVSKPLVEREFVALLKQNSDPVPGQHPVKRLERAAS